jgi:hypothetical protein
MEFYFPTEFGEQLAFSAAAISAIIGLVIMFAPGLVLSFLDAHTKTMPAIIMGVLRSYGGMHLGLGISATLVAQNWAYFAVGGCFAVSSIAILLSVLLDGGATVRNCLLLVVHSALAILPLMYVFGWV